ncbi:MAG: M6 family metalloprotease domain-containing protein, partial [candidate division WOR-3 bacterium]|nr:M6 family metalloprotease domain-containing protein [candidate division WOR-3 bacterium]
MKKFNCVQTIITVCLISLLPSLIFSMPPIEGLKIPESFLEEDAELGINISTNPIRDIGKKGIRNTLGDITLLVSGTKRFPVVLIKYPDYDSMYSVSNFQQMLFNGPWTSGTAKDYYHEISYNIFTLDGTCYGWYTADSNRAYYGRANGMTRAAMLAKEAAQKADPFVDYSQFDNDGDGYVDCFTCLHSGYGYEETGNGADIHSHSWSFTGAGIGAYLTNDGVWINQYVIDPERSNSSNNGTMVTIGVFCHEWGHALGLPDLYDTDGGGEGLGRWCLMSSGSWGASAPSSPWFPSHMCAWAKMELGWLNPTAVRVRNFRSLPQVETNSKAYWLMSQGVTYKEYFLVENRRKTHFDTLMYNSGLLIYHIDDYVINSRWSTNQVNGGGAFPYGVALEQADGLNHLWNGINRGDAGDPYPGTTNNIAFDSTGTNPNSLSNASTITACGVNQIPASAPTVSPFMYSAFIGSFTGGPDASGYRWIDSDTTSGPTYSWIDITSVDAFLGRGNDALYSFVLPYNFNFYGTNYTDVRVSTNGWLSFGPSPGNSFPGNTSVPNAGAPNQAVFVFWDDLNLLVSDSGGIYYQTLGSAPNRYTVVTWQNARRNGAGRPGTASFQAILYENGTIILQYQGAGFSDTLYNWGRSATVGVENSTGNVGLEYLYDGVPNGNLLSAERAIRFYPSLIPANEDVGSVAIFSPVGRLDSATTIVPQCSVYNYGDTLIDSFPVIFRITGPGPIIWTDTQMVYSLDTATGTTVSFNNWTAGQRGSYTTRCSTALTGDVNTSNDWQDSSFIVDVHDAGVIDIVAPTGLVAKNSVITPQATVRNYGSVRDSFDVILTIGASYLDTVFIALDPNTQTTINFANWTATPIGTHLVRCTTALAGDLITINDILS